MAKRASPALYEMMRSQAATPTVPSISPLGRAAPAPQEEEFEVMRDEATPSPMLERLVALLRPGRTLRVPVGYLLMACGAILLLLSLTYVIGVSRGKSIQTAAFRERLGENFDLSPRPAVTDPLTLEPRDNGSSTNQSNSETPVQGGLHPAAEQASAIGRPSSEWGPVVPAADPRRKGWNYFILAEDTLEGMKRLVEFCRANGLETYVVAGNNDRRRVIAFPGYQGSRLAPEVRALEDRIHAIGDKYKSQNRSQTNMRDAYPALFGG